MASHRHTSSRARDRQSAAAGEPSDGVGSGLIVLVGAGGRHAIHPETWAASLLEAADHGWHPDELMAGYLADGLEVSAGQAAKLVQAWEKLFAGALTDPMSAYPVRVDMGELCRLKEFCQARGFRVTWAQVDQGRSR